MTLLALGTRIMTEFRLDHHLRIKIRTRSRSKLEFVVEHHQLRLSLLHQELVYLLVRALTLGHQHHHLRLSLLHQELVYLLVRALPLGHQH